MNNAIEQYCVVSDNDSGVKDFTSIDDALAYIEEAVSDGYSLDTFYLIKGELLNLKSKIVVE